MRKTTIDDNNNKLIEILLVSFLSHQMNEMQSTEQTVHNNHRLWIYSSHDRLLRCVAVVVDGAKVRRHDKSARNKSVAEDIRAICDLRELNWCGDCGDEPVWCAGCVCGEDEAAQNGSQHF